MKLKCPYCGSHRTQNVGGENGDPFDRRPEKMSALIAAEPLVREWESKICSNT